MLQAQPVAGSHLSIARPVCCRAALAALAKHSQPLFVANGSSAHAEQAERRWLEQWMSEAIAWDEVEALFTGEEVATHAVDAGLVRLQHSLSLSMAEILTVALALEVELNPVVGRVLAWLQRPTGGARPMLSLLAAAFDNAGLQCAVDSLATGVAVSCGLLTLSEPAAPLPERAIALPTHLLLALQGKPAQRSGAVVDVGAQDNVSLTASLEATAAKYAEGLRDGGALVVRAGDPFEARAVCAAVAEHLGAVAIFLDEDATTTGLVPWMHLAQLTPVFVRRLSPGERFSVPRLEGWLGPILVASGPDGTVESQRGATLSWSVDIPSRDERSALWLRALGNADLATELAQHRHSAGRIAQLSRLAQQVARASEREQPSAADVYAASFQGDGGLETLAQPLRDRVDEAALVLGAPLRRELDLLLARCAQREQLVAGLGTASMTRYRPGVRALFVGPSGTGKTLAVSWLACRLSLPLYRVDMASVVSKYIGETEKNLSDLLARAESAEVILFFDEADSLFGKRTDVQHSTDRFANAQTNYLLQRIESYDGIVVLASNSRTRFDPAFSRRLDQIVEFVLPGPEERRALWLAHLGQAHELSSRDLNELAMSCELAGGHIRNAVLAAAVMSRRAGCLITREDLLLGLSLEYRKLGKSMPPNLAARSPR